MNKTQMRKLSLQRGDILVIEKGFNIGPNWQKVLADAAKAAGVDFNVPVIFVDNIDHITVVRMGQEIQ